MCSSSNLGQQSNHQLEVRNWELGVSVSPFFFFLIGGTGENKKKEGGGIVIPPKSFQCSESQRRKGTVHNPG